ncbi:ABC transporter B member 11 [Asimina triloba]
MKKGSNRTETDLNAVETSAVAGRQLSVQKSLSHGSSIGVGNSSRHSFSVSFGIPNGLDIHVSTRRELDVPLPPQQSKEIPLCRLASLNKPEIPLLLVGTIAAGINGSIFPVFGILFSSVIHTFYEPPSELQKDSRFWALMFIVIGTTALVASPVQSYLFAVAGCRLTKRIQSMAFKKVVYTEVGWFDNSENSSGAVGARISMEAAILRSLVGDALALIIQNMTSAVAGLIIAFLACWQLALIVLAMLPLLGISGWIQMKFMDGLGAESKKMCEEASQVANDAVVNIRTVASFCAEEKVMEMYAEKCEGPMKKGIKQGLISGISLGLSNFFLYCILATTFYFGAHLVANGKTSFTKVFRVFFALTMSINSFILSSSIVLNASKAKSSAASIFAIIDRKSEIDASDETGITIEDLRGDIEFQDVSFKYPTRPETRIFRDICLAIQSGKLLRVNNYYSHCQTVALVGENGSGKSTVISLLQRFYNPDSGKIWLDGIEIQMLQLRWLRQQMGLVGQEPILFNDTIRANIVYGRDGDATEAEIIAAAESANAHKFISHLQQGYDTTVGERGIQLSGGQKQRLAIARAIMKEPKILLLDEATSALDAESERMVQETLDQLTVHRTTIIVAHRLSTIQGADLIAVVKNGVIIEKGNHEALINNKAGPSLFLFYASVERK